MVCVCDICVCMCAFCCMCVQMRPEECLLRVVQAELATLLPVKTHTHTLFLPDIHTLTYPHNMPQLFLNKYNIDQYYNCFLRECTGELVDGHLSSVVQKGGTAIFEKCHRLLFEISVTVLA